MQASNNTSEDLCVLQASYKITDIIGHQDVHISNKDAALEWHLQELNSCTLI